MTLPTKLRLVVVTPETTLLDQPVDSLRVPMFDGSAGFLPGRAPLVGKLGFGELRMTDASGSKSYFVEEGFVQVKGETVSVLTARATEVSAIDVGAAEKALSEATARTATTEIERTARRKDVDRARAQLALARR
jgi:F-type H+-transporting ATPase subunit epsilon